jgi:hypothetical protein
VLTFTLLGCSGSGLCAPDGVGPRFCPALRGHAAVHWEDALIDGLIRVERAGDGSSTVGLTARGRAALDG